MRRFMACFKINVGSARKFRVMDQCSLKMAAAPGSAT